MSTVGAELAESFEACRTCGIFFMTSSNYLRLIFTKQGIEADPSDAEMALIRMQLAAWNVDITENDGFSQYICTSCIHEFQNVFKFRRSCIDMQQEIRNSYAMQKENQIKIKTELPDAQEMEKVEKICDFIYVDDLSDTECGGGAVSTPFHILHVPIKEEPIIEEATVPKELPVGSIEEAGDKLISPKKESLTESMVNSNGFKAPTVLQTTDNIISFVQCNLCQHIAGNHLELRDHKKKIHELKKQNCPICGKTFYNCTPSRLRFHMRWHRIRRHINCTQCCLYFDSRDTLKQHIHAMHEKISCRLCGTSLTFKEMRAHMREHAVMPDYVQWTCPYCTEAFSTEESKIYHVRHIHNVQTVRSKEKNDSPNTSSLICKPCDQEFKSQLELTIHTGQYHSFVNEIENTQSRIHLDPVLKREIDESEEQTLQSSTRSYSSNSKAGSPVKTYEDSLHNSEVIDEEEYACSEMSLENSNCDDLNASDIVNESNGDIACAKCPQTFTSIEELLSHSKEHMQDLKSKFVCNICSKTFELKFSLNRHIEKHNHAPF